MKRFGYLLHQIADPDNLRLAFLKARRGKSTRSSVLEFQSNLHQELKDIRTSILSGQPKVGDYHFFQVFDPKPRLICAAHFRERVLHHAIMNVCESILDRALIHHTYACRKNKGTFAAIHQAQRFSRHHTFYLQCDIRKYFDSIDQALCLQALSRRIKDRSVIHLFESILNTYETQPGKGLPIGNLISQHLANYYLTPLDQWLASWNPKGYLRYMDDFVLWSNDRESLKAMRSQIREFLGDRLKLELKGEPGLNRVDHGIPFLGHRVYPCILRLSQRSKKRFMQKFRELEKNFESGWIDDSERQRKADALLGFICHADTLTLRRKFFYPESTGVSAIKPSVPLPARTA